MRKVIYSLMVSLDGFMEGPNKTLDWVIVDEELHRFVNDQERLIDTHLYGRRMYEVMRYWDTADSDPSSPAYEVEYALIWQNISKIVFSKTLTQVGPNARLVTENVGQEIAKLKEQPGKDMALGGATFASTIMRLGLIDEYWLYVQPIVLGGSTPMFPTLETQINLRLVETRPFDSGVVLLRYQTDRNKSQ